ncbi:cytochrome c oxidase subunit 3 family protein [Rhizobium daejeonense]|uniref:Cytochrome c oxidase subunit 3 family protein n=1 Tax=Rhizobium daejeonense TaxID=240521 RepID=A0A6M1S5I3_9HYPH|nr:cytochrome c oxidase subunit 3 [Rhizobium daejeonense]NGO66183.1 cytochrome c oxidase subunit 3 family protein [Rhizobium daejeonense]
MNASARLQNMTVSTVAEEEGDTLLLWILVWSELIAFGILLAGFLVMSLLEPERFALARHYLNPGLAALNTLILLSSGWQAALAARRTAPPVEVRRSLVIAAFLGFAFMAVKLAEYAGEVGHAGEEALSGFFEIYFLITGFHLLHVVFGSVILLIVAWRPARQNVLMITTLWHVIDLVWIVMFPILYLA